MDNSLFEKTTTLAGALLRSPSLVGPYVRYLPVWGRLPADVELPWISFGALKFLNGFVQSNHEVFEYGGGGSTLYFARRAKSVLTMESHAEWHRALSSTLIAKGLTNVVTELHPITSDELEDFREDTFFQRIRAQKWDVILVDCYCGYSRTRYGLIRPFALDLAFEQLKPGGVIVLDDSWMFRELLSPREGWRITDHIGPGPCRYGITSTAIFEKQ